MSETTARTYISGPLSGPLAARLFGRLHLFSSLLGLTSLAVCYVVYGTRATDFLGRRLDEPVLTLALLAGLICLHELCHFLSFPRFGFDGQGIFGFKREAFAPYAAYAGLLPRNRFVFCALAPCLMLSVVPLVWCLLNGFSGWLLIGSTGNLALCGGDVYMAWITYRRASRGSLINGDDNGIYFVASSERATLPMPR